MGIFGYTDRIDVYVHLDATALGLLREISQKQEIVMATQQEILDKLSAANASLDGIQADITALKALVDGGANLDQIAAAVTALADKAAGIDSQTT